jgi:hypothetical protein
MLLFSLAYSFYFIIDFKLFLQRIEQDSNK